MDPHRYERYRRCETNEQVPEASEDLTPIWRNKTYQVAILVSGTRRVEEMHLLMDDTAQYKKTYQNTTLALCRPYPACKQKSIFVGREEKNKSLLWELRVFFPGIHAQGQSSSD